MCDDELEWDKLCNDKQVELLLSHLRKARQMYDTAQDDDDLGMCIHFVVDCVKTFIAEPISLHYLSLIQTENIMLGVLIGKGADLLPVGIGRLWEFKNHLPMLRDALEVAVAENEYLLDFKFDFKFDDFDPDSI